MSARVNKRKKKKKLNKSQLSALKAIDPTQILKPLVDTLSPERREEANKECADLYQSFIETLGGKKKGEEKGKSEGKEEKRSEGKEEKKGEVKGDEEKKKSE